MILAIQSRLYVELKGKYDNFEENSARFDDSKMRGLVRDIAPDLIKEIEKLPPDRRIKVGSMVYFGKYEDTARFEVDGKWCALIKLEEIGGVDNEVATASKA